MLEVFRAKSGDLSASTAAGLLHSRYDPPREAARYVERTFGDTVPATVFLLGVGLGYLISALRDRFPACRIIAVSTLNAARREFTRRADAYVDVSEGGPGRAIEHLIGPADVAGFELLEWEPELRATPDLAGASRAAIREVVTRRNADVATTGFFGPRYLKNALRNLLFAESPATPAGTGEGPVCIAASGPSLEQATGWIREHRRNLEVWALSSAAPALAARGITPDLVFHQDAGYYATLHLQQASRHPDSSPVVMPATAAVPPGDLRRRPLLLNQGTRAEEDLYRALGMEPLRTTETGTVAATATALALEITAGTVYLAGLDLSRQDIRAHASPHAFEPYLQARESRLNPVYSQLAAEAFDRTARLPGERRPPARGERSLDIYADWFRSLPPHLARRLRRVAPSDVDIGVKPAAPDEEPAASAPAGADRPGAPSTSPTLKASGSRVVERATATAAVPETAAGRARVLSDVVRRWQTEIRSFTDGETGGEPGNATESSAAELCYLVAAADYVSAVAAGRRGDDAARRQSLERLRASTDRVFDRLREIADRVAERGS